MNVLYLPVASRANHRCEYCHAPETMFNFPFEVEHIVPVSRGGPTELENLALCCRSCNLYKAGFVKGITPTSGVYARLFHPRRDDWNKHFSASADTGIIAGKTNIGRATIFRLKINSPAQINARLQWKRLELFP